MQISKIVLSIFDKNKMWGSFWIQKHFELHPTFLLMTKMFLEDENLCQDKRNG